MATDWKGYQEETADFFRRLGLDAQTDVTMAGVRTTHNVDVLVKSHHVGFDITWVIECKHWKSRVSKLHVLALREIVSDLGADRGILLSESGFQSGAEEAATLTTVQVTSLAALAGTTKPAVFALRLRDLYDLVGACKERYWGIPKRVRIEAGLRTEVFDSGYSGARVIDCSEDVLRKAFRGTYPFANEALYAVAIPGAPSQFASPDDVLAHLEPMVLDLEARLNAYDASKNKQNAE